MEEASPWMSALTGETEPRGNRSEGVDVRKILNGGKPEEGKAVGLVAF